MAAIYLAEAGGLPTSYEEEHARTLWQQGALSPATLCWKEGMPDWRPAGEVFGPAASLPPAPAPMTAPVPVAVAAYAAPLPAVARHGPAIAAQRYGAPAQPFRLEKDPTGLTKFLKVMMWIGLSLASVAVVLGAISLATGSARSSNEEELTAMDAFGALVGLTQILVFIGTSIPFLMWVHRANRNARALGARGMQFTPGWAVGWYFVPFANLWKPLQAMKEIWQASHNPRAWGSEPAPSLVSNWWGLWLLSNFLGQMSFRMAFRAQTPQANLNAELVGILSDMVDIGLCLVAMRVLDRICCKQVEWAQRGG